MFHSCIECDDQSLRLGCRLAEPCSSVQDVRPRSLLESRSYSLSVRPFAGEAIIGVELRDLEGLVI